MIFMNGKMPAKGLSNTKLLIDTSIGNSFAGTSHITKVYDQSHYNYTIVGARNRLFNVDYGKLITVDGRKLLSTNDALFELQSSPSNWDFLLGDNDFTILSTFHVPALDKNRLLFTTRKGPTKSGMYIKIRPNGRCVVAWRCNGRNADGLETSSTITASGIHSVLVRYKAQDRSMSITLDGTTTTSNHTLRTPKDVRSHTTTSSAPLFGRNGSMAIGMLGCWDRYIDGNELNLLTKRIISEWKLT